MSRARHRKAIREPGGRTDWTSPRRGIVGGALRGTRGQRGQRTDTSTVGRPKVDPSRSIKPAGTWAPDLTDLLTESNWHDWRCLPRERERNGKRRHDIQCLIDCQKII